MEGDEDPPNPSFPAPPNSLEMPDHATGFFDLWWRLCTYLYMSLPPSGMLVVRHGCEKRWMQ